MQPASKAAASGLDLLRMRRSGVATGRAAIFLGGVWFAGFASPSASFIFFSGGKVASLSVALRFSLFESWDKRRARMTGIQ